MVCRAIPMIAFHGINLYIYIFVSHTHYIPVFLISSYGSPLAQRASYLALHSSLFGPDGAVNYDYIITNSINSLLIGSRCIPNGAHTNHFEPIWPMLQNLSKTLLHTYTM